MTIKTYMTRETLEGLVINSLKKGYTMEAVRMVIDKLNIQIREVH